jgi:hypothetical protein
MRLFLVVLLLMGLLYGRSEHYKIPEAKVSYTIEGGGALTPESNLSLVGESTLLFKKWGSELVINDSATAKLTGLLHGNFKLQRYEKQAKNTFYTVDFTTQTIHTRRHATSNIIKELNLDGFTLTGKENIIGLTCDVWEGYGIKKCIYRGIPLLIESNAMGIHYKRVATRIDLGKITEKEFALPNLPIEHFAIFKNKFKDREQQVSECFASIVRDMATKEQRKEKSYKQSVYIYNHDRAKFLNRLTHRIFIKQKNVLLQLVDILKNARLCIQHAKTLFEVNECTVEYKRFKHHLGDNADDYLIYWDEAKKEQLVNNIEKRTRFILGKEGCVRRAQNITDLSRCMKP